MDAVGGGLLILASFLAMELGCRRRFFLPVILPKVRAAFQRSEAPKPEDGDSAGGRTLTAD